MDSILFDLLVFTSAAVIFVPLFRLFNLGPILAYLLAGTLIGPHATGLIQDPEVILHFSELGVVFLLFIIGLELAPEKLWSLRRSIFGLGLLQVLVTGTLFMALGVVLGLSWQQSFVAGFGLALSSTAFGIQLLEESRQLNTTHGQGSFSILMFQDLAVVPLLASIAFLQNQNSMAISWLNVIKVVGIVITLIFAGRFLVRHVLRLVANSKTQEVFTAISLLIVVGTALLMESVGLSKGMGAFLAGVLLANSEYRHELEINLTPFKGLLLGLFFIAVGMSLDLTILAKKPHWIFLLAVSFMAIKGLIIFFLGRLFSYSSEPSRNMALTILQGGEFAFVLFSSAVGQGLLPHEMASMLNASVIMSMIFTPFIFSFNQKRLRTFSELSERPYDDITSEGAEVIIGGYGRFGQIVARFLTTQKVGFTILEHNAAQVETARKFGSKIYYGDASREDMLSAAGAKTAQIFVLAIDDIEKSVETAAMVRKRFPHLHVIARARNRQHAIKLMELGITNIHRETYLTSLEVAKEVMLHKGLPRETINKQLAAFRMHDESILRQQYELRNDEKQFVSYTTKANQELERILSADK